MCLKTIGVLIMETTAADRIRIIRELMGLTRREFALLIGIRTDQLTNLEQKKAHVRAEHLELLGKKFPQLMPFLTYNGEITMSDILESDEAMLRAMAARIQAGITASVADISHKIK